MTDLNFWLVGGGFVIGLLFGVITQRSRFCVLAAASNFVLMRDRRQLHAYLAAMAVALAGTAMLEQTGLVPIADTTYRMARLDWLGLIGGSLIFGFGMVMAGGCVGRLLVRGAEGNATALLALLMVAVSAAICIFGVLAPIRMTIANETAFLLPASDASLSSLLAVPVWVIPVVLTVAIITYIGSTLQRDSDNTMIYAGVAIGLLVVLGWFVTGYLAYDPFNMNQQRPASLTFAGPLARTTYFAMSGELVGNSFHVAVVLGVLAGALSSVIQRGTMRWSMPSWHGAVRAVCGGFLMGIGATFAGGCNIGQGLTGFSTCSLSAMIAVAGIVVGMRIGLAWLLSVENETERARPVEVGVHAIQSS